MLHDLGCVEEHYQRCSGAHCFAVEGAFAAEAFLTAKNFPPSRAQAIAEAITLHLNDWGVDDRHGTTARYLYAGAACDVDGERSKAIPRSTAKNILTRYPGAGFETLFVEFLQREAALRPDARIAAVHASLAEQGSAAPEVFPWKSLEA